MTLECATARVRPMFEQKPEAYISVARYEHPREHEEYVSVGAGRSAREARGDLVALLEGEGVHAPAVRECVDPNLRRSLLWSAKSRAMLGGQPIVVASDA